MCYYSNHYRVLIVCLKRGCFNGRWLGSGTWDIKKYYVSEDELWAAFNYVFSDACAKRSTYKFGLIKSILDNLLSVVSTNRGVEITYEELFSKFAEE